MARPLPLALPDPVPGVLADGTVLRFVPVTPAHREQLRRGFDETSPESRYRRFLTPLSRLTEEQLDYLTNVDFVNHVAWGAEVAETSRGIAIGRWIRLQGEPETAEAAIAVIDEYHGQGLGRALLWLLAASAIERGVKRFRAEILADNEPMLALLEGLGAEIVGRSGTVLEVSIPVPASIDELREAAAPKILRAAAEGTVRFAPMKLI
ncbi:MAG TPA: GNAT family N-acetyltransferase [Candidatus Dormibacteraeota bacterium]